MPNMQRACTCAHVYGWLTGWSRARDLRVGRRDEGGVGEATLRHLGGLCTEQVGAQQAAPGVLYGGQYARVRGDVAPPHAAQEAGREGGGGRAGRGSGEG